MVEDKLRTYGRDDRIPRKVIEQTSYSGIGDEFARLIQQRDVYGGCSETRSPARSTYNDGSSDRDDRAPISPNRRASIFLPTGADDRDNADIQAAAFGGGYGAGHNHDDVLRWRGGLVVAIIVLALTVLGTVSTFAYRAMFSAYVFSALPQIVKAGTKPDNTVRNHSDVSQSSITSVGSNEKLASREQQPAATAPGLDPPVASALDPPVASALDPDVPPSVPTPASVQVLESKKIHAVMVGSDERSATDTISPSALARHSPTRAAAKSSAAAAPPSGSHGAHGDISPSTSSRFHMRAGRRTAEGAYSAGSYAVQVASEHSAAAAHASFRALHATFPNQLGGRKPIVRRTDLGAKGIYYRAMVGPFASMQKAAGMCARLKTVGGDCLVQRN